LVPTGRNRSERTAGDKRVRDEELTAAAIDVFFRKGYAGASVQEVADKIGVLKGSLYHYINSKEDLLFRIFDESHAQASAILDDKSLLALEPLPRLRAFVERYMQWFLENIERVTVYQREWVYVSGRHRETVLAQRMRYEQFVREILTEAKESGAADPELDVSSAALFILGALRAVPYWYAGDDPGSAERIAAQYGDLALRLATATGA
jgi:AcrR family transcriptional regulator